jgi:hypothetical protein
MQELIDVVAVTIDGSIQLEVVPDRQNASIEFVHWSLPRCCCTVIMAGVSASRRRLIELLLRH